MPNLIPVPKEIKYNGVFYDGIEEVKTKAGLGTDHKVNKLGFLEFGENSLVVINEGRKKDQLTTGPVINVPKPTDSLDFDLMFAQPGLSYDIKQVDVTNKKGQVISRDLVLDIVSLDQRARKTIVVKDQFNENNNGAGIENISIRYQAKQESGGIGITLPSYINISLINPASEVGGKPTKKSFEQIEREFKGKMSGAGGELLTGLPITPIPVETSKLDKDMSEAAKLARAALGNNFDTGADNVSLKDFRNRVKELA